MRMKSTALLALGSLMLGFALGRVTAPDSPGPTSATTAAAVSMPLPDGHPRMGERSLGDAVASTLQRLPSAGGATADAMADTGAGTNIVDQADALRRQRKFKESIELYRRAVAEERMSADAWADYADALASAASSLQGEPEQALARALALDPRHAKALWLKASLQHEQRRYADAVLTWRSLLAVVPKESSDARIIQANIAEASRLATGA